MSTISLARSPWKYTSTYDTFLSQKASDFYKLRFATSGKHNAVNDKSLVRTVRRNFYMRKFRKSVKTPQEAIETYQKVKKIQRWVKIDELDKSDDEVNSQISEKNRSAKTVKTFVTEQ